MNKHSHDDTTNSLGLTIKDIEGKLYLVNVAHIFCPK